MGEHEHHEEKKHSGGHGPGGHGGGGHEEHEGAPEWLISFADNVMLQMGFFVILLAMNMGIKAKNEALSEGDGEHAGGGSPTELVDLAIAVRAGFNNPVNMDSVRPEDQPLIRRILQKRTGNSNQPGDSGTEREAQSIRPTQFSSLGGTIPFEDGSSALTSLNRARADSIADKLKGLRWIIEVRGHASPSETFQDPGKGMNLAYFRARAVAEILVSKGVKWEQIRLVAAGDNERKVDRTYDRSADAFNQRAEIIVTQEKWEESAAAGGIRVAPPAAPSEEPDYP